MRIDLISLEVNIRTEIRFISLLRSKDKKMLIQFDVQGHRSVCVQRNLLLLGRILPREPRDYLCRAAAWMRPLVTKLTKRRASS